VGVLYLIFLVMSEKDFLAGKEDFYHGIIVDSNQLPSNSEIFHQMLKGL